MYKLQFFITFIILQNSFAVSFNCKDEKILDYHGKKVSLCEQLKGIHYISKECLNSPRDCFLVKDIKLEIRPNQSPGFSLCYDIQGEPFFGKIDGEEEKVPICKLKNYFIDHDSLIKVYKEVK